MFRFTIRELVLLTIIVALGVALFAERSRSFDLNHKLESLRQYTRAHGFDIQVFEPNGLWAILDVPEETKVRQKEPPDGN